MKKGVSASNHQDGAVAIMVALSLALLIGFLGLALDMGRLFIVKTELQNAMDACALAAAGALGTPGQLAVAESRGILVGEKNKVDFQRDYVDIQEDRDVTFSTTLNGNYLPKGSADPASTYARCEVTPGGFVPWFMQVLQSWLGEPSGPNSVNAFAVATLGPGQVACAIPVGLCMKPGGTETDPFVGFEVGRWECSKFPTGIVSVDCPTPTAPHGSFNWIDFTPTGGGASELADILAGVGACEAEIGDCVGEPGNMQSLAKAWNTRFGLYQGGLNVGNALPDWTGFAYKPTTAYSPMGKPDISPTTWREFSDAPQNAYSGTPAAGVIAQNFLASRTNYITYQNTNPNRINPLNGITSAQHAALGGDRRLVTVPVVDCSKYSTGYAECSSPKTVKILGFACVLMLHPFDDPKDDIYLEYLGSANTPGNPCATSGLPGGLDGPPVPTLVQ